ncbi:hypothetical protein C8J56DRAFT_1059028 [Mycena floridula]|nr:hypothetical protein C8J56DRAFT_1059028 [Mycena floridula]
MVDNKEKSPAHSSDSNSASAQILSALLERIDQLTAQVADLSIAVAHGHSSGATGATGTTETKAKDDDDTVVVDSQNAPASSGIVASSADDIPLAGPSTGCGGGYLTAPENPHFMTCPKCNHRFPPPPPKEPWYVVTVGRQVGVFNDWNIVAPHVVGVRGAIFKRYDTKASADAAFLVALQGGNVHVVA